MKTEITSWVDQYNGKTYYALRVYEKGYLQWQSQPCMDEESAKAQLKNYLNQKCGLLQEITEYFNSTTKDELEKDWEDVKHLNQIGPDVEEYYNSADMTTPEQPKDNEDCFVLFKQLPRLNDRYEVKEYGEFIPNLYWLNEKWYISWDDADGRTLDIYWASTIEEVVRIAFDSCQAKITTKQKSE